MLQCEFDRKGVCLALACYSNLKCGARDNKGNPKYCSLKEVKIAINAKKRMVDDKI